MFFENFPVTFHKTLDGENILVTDFIRAIRIPDDILNDQNLYLYYTAKDGDTPEIISHKFYKSTQYHWVIMAINQKYDMWNDYPKTDAAIRRSCAINYDSLDGIHHYTNEAGEIVDAYTYPRTPVTNYEYELSRNERKRITKILRPELLSEFISIYQDLIGE